MEHETLFWSVNDFQNNVYLATWEVIEKDLR